MSALSQGDPLRSRGDCWVEARVVVDSDVGS